MMESIPCETEPEPTHLLPQENFQSGLRILITVAYSHLELSIDKELLQVPRMLITMLPVSFRITNCGYRV